MSEDFVTIAAYSVAMKAEAAKNFLETNGIRAFVDDENFASTMWSNLAETKLQVAAADAERARQLLSEHHDADDLTDEDSET